MLDDIVVEWGYYCGVGHHTTYIYNQEYDMCHGQVGLIVYPYSRFRYPIYKYHTQYIQCFKNGTYRFLTMEEPQNHGFQYLKRILYDFDVLHFKRTSYGYGSQQCIIMGPQQNPWDLWMFIRKEIWYHMNNLHTFFLCVCKHIWIVNIFIYVMYVVRVYIGSTV